MNPRNWLSAGLSAARFRLTGRRTPIVATVVVTTRCESLCLFCASPLRPVKEPTTAELCERLDALVVLGCQGVVLAGGEPLTRPDLPALIQRLRAAGLWVALETEGRQYPEKADALGVVDRLVLPLEGPADVHDALREPGSHAGVLRALEAARVRGITVHTHTTLTRQNLDHLDYIVDFAVEHGHQASFAVADARGGCEHEVRPDADALRDAMAHLADRRRDGAPIALSETTLRSLATWPDESPTSTNAHAGQHCVAGQLHCYVDVDGRLYACRVVAARAEVPGPRLSATLPPIDAPCLSCTSPDLCELNHRLHLTVPGLLDGAGRTALSIATAK